MMPIKTRVLLAAFTLISSITLTSCYFPVIDSSVEKNSKSDNAPDAVILNITPTKYTFDDLQAKLADINIESQEFLNENEYTCSETALEYYNLLLGYAESIIDAEDYYITCYSYQDLSHWRQYAVYIVLKEWLEEYEKYKNDSYEMSSIVMNIRIESDEKFTGLISSSLEPFLMARKWTADLKADFAESFPDYHINVEYASLNLMIPNPAREDYEQFDDYTYFFAKKNKRFYLPDGGARYANKVNIFLPSETRPEDLEHILEEISPFLERNYISGGDFYILSENDFLENILSEERQYSNSGTVDYFEMASCKKRFIYRKEAFTISD